jgi:hypothetical protein
MNVLVRFRAWRLARAELALADAEHHFEWTMTYRRLGTVDPSRAHEKAQVEKLQRRVQRLRPREGKR